MNFWKKLFPSEDSQNYAIEPPTAEQQKAIEEVIDELGRAPSRDWLQELTNTLVKIGNPAIPALERACKSQYLKERELAPQILASIWHSTKSPATVLALVNALKYPDADYAAYDALLSIRDTRAIPALIKILPKVRPWNRDKVASLVSKIGNSADISRVKNELRKVAELPDPGVPSDFEDGF